MQNVNSAQLYGAQMPTAAVSFGGDQPLPSFGDPGQTPTPPPPLKPRRSFKRLLRRLGVVTVALLLIAGGSLLFIVSQRKNQSVNSTVSESQADPASRFDTLQVPLSELSGGGGLQIDGSRTLSINGQLHVNNTLIVSPTAQPTSAVAGQIYYDQSTNRLSYYNGSTFVELRTPDNSVLAIGGIRGNVGLGNGLAANNGIVANTGVLSLQGQTGQVTLAAGAGVAVDGTTLSNTGVLNIGGQSGAIALGAGLTAAGGTVKNSGILDVASGSPSITVVNDGSGHVTISGAAGGSGTVSSPGGTAGAIAKFTGAQAIADSLLTESGTLITVNGDLQVTGTTTLNTPLGVASGGTGASSLTSNGVVIGQGASMLTTVTAGGSGLCLVSTAGAPSFQACPGSGGVASVNGLTGVLTIANATGAGSTVTINDAGTAQKGIAQFNNTNFSVSLGTVNTVQDIAATASPTFAGLSLSSALSVLNGGTGATTAAGARSNLGAAVSGANGDITSTTALNTITPSAGFTLGATGQTFTLQGNGSSTIVASNGTFSTTIGFTNPIANTTINLPASVAGTYTVCTTAGNCAGAGGGVTTPGGTAGQLARFTGAQAIGDSIVTDNGSTVTIAGAGVIQGSSGLTLGVASSTVGKLVFANATNANTFTLQSGATASNLSFTLPTADGSPNQCLSTNGSGLLSFHDCLSGSGGGGGVASLNGLVGTLVVANASGVGSTITINDAGTAQKGIVQFNSTNFSVSAGVANTIQDIATTSSPTFAGLTLTSALSVANGGTGAVTLASNGILYGNGTGAIQVTGSAANSVLVTNGLSVPSLNQTLPGAVQGNITSTGALTSGSIASGFGTISTGNNISTTATVQGGTSVLTPLLDTVSAGTLGIGTTNATGINLNQSTALAAGKNLSFASGAGNFDQSASSGTFATGTGAVSINGTTTIAANKTFSSNGSAVFKDATNSTTAFQVQNSSGLNLLSVDTVNNAIISNGTIDPGNLLQNGGFEVPGTGTNTQATGWGNNAFDTIINNSTNAHRGNRYLQVTADGSIDDTVDVQKYRVKPGDVMYAEGWLNSSSATGTGGYWLQFQDKDGGALQTNSVGGSYISAPSSWTQITGTQTAPANSAYVVIGASVRTGATGTWLFDDVVLKKINSNAPQIVQPTVDTTTAFQVQNAAGSAILAVDSSNAIVSVGKASTITGNLTVYSASGSGSISLQAANPASTNYTITIPAENGTLCTTAGSSACTAVYAPASGSGSYIQLQGTTPGSAQTGNFNISGTGIAGTLQAGTIDTASAAALNVGTTNATGINLNQATIVASNKAFTANGSALFKDATNSTAAFQVQNSSAANLFTVDSSNAAIVFGNDVTPSALTVRGGAATTSNTTGANLTFDASNGTGVGGSGALIFRTAPAITNAEVTFDSGEGHNSNGVASSTSWTHTTASQSNRILVVGVMVNGLSTTVSSVTYDTGGSTQNLTKLDALNCPNGAGGCRVELWYLLAPHTGAHTMQVNLSGTIFVAAGAATYYNVDQATPFGSDVTASGTQGLAGTTSVAVPTTTGQVVVDTFGNNNGGSGDGTIAGAGESLAWDNTYNSLNYDGGSYKAATGTSTTMSWNALSADWATVAAPLNPAPNSSPDALADRLHISAAGNVGIGTASPSYPLDVTGDINTSTQYRIGGTVICTSSGCTPAAGSNNYIQLQGSTPGTAQTGNFNISGTGVAGTLQAGTIDTASAGALTVGNTNATNIAIGKTSSNIATTINGTALVKPTAGNDSTTAFQVQNAGGTSVLTVDTTNSQLKLRNLNNGAVAGSEMFTGSEAFGAATNWSVSGTGSGATATHSNGNTATVSASPALTITAGAVYKVAWTVSGYSAGNVTVKIGGVNGSTLSGNGTQADYITATTTGNLVFTPASSFVGTIGSVSVVPITSQTPVLTVNDSTGSANFELHVGTASDGNLGIGYNALPISVGGVGISNTGVGEGALQTTTSGSNNAALGYAALENNTTGNNNTAIGYQTLQAATSGLFNSGVGANALGSATTASNNTGIGNSALRDITTGNSNTALGYRTGYQDSSQADFQTLRTISNATLIGNSAQATCSSCIVLGGQGASAVTGVGIGTPNPTNFLSVEPLEYNTGTVDTTSGSGSLVGTGTTFTSAMVGSEIYIASNSTTTATYKGTISTFTDATHITVTPTVGYTLAGAHFYILYSGLQVKTDGTVYAQGSSTTQYAVQNASGTSVFNVDTTNQQISVRNLNDAAVVSSTELFTGGSQTFSAATNWTITLNSGGSTATAAHTSGSTAATSASPALTVAASTVYKVTYTVSSYSAGSVTAGIGGVSGSAFSAAGTHTDYINTTGTGNLTFTPTSGFIGTVGSVFVEQVSNQTPSIVIKDSTGATAAELRVSTATNGSLALGINALQTNVTGTQNIAIGEGALQGNTTGTSNVALGYQALQSNGTANNNTALGYQVLRNSTSANNTAIGYQALMQNTTGGGNVGIGYSSLFNDSTGFNNTAIGQGALNDITSGSNNTAIGYFAGQQGTTQSDFQTTRNITNAAMIGAGAQANCSNCLVLGGQGTDSLTGGVGIGTPNPTNFLSVEPLEYNTGTVDTTSGSGALVGTGTTFTSAMVGSEIYIASNSTTTATYRGTISAFTDATHITVTGNVGYTLAGAHFYILYSGLQVKSDGTVYTQGSSTSQFTVQNANGTSLLAVDTTAPSSNLLTNPGFETNTSGWQATGTGASIARDTTSGHNVFARASLAVSLGAGSGTGVQITSSGYSGGSLAAGTYTFGLYAAGSASISGLSISGFNGGTCNLNGTFVQSLPFGFNRYSCTFTTSGATTGNISITATTGSQTLYIDGVQLVSGNTLPAFSYGNIQMPGIITTPVTIKPTVNENNLFQIQNASGSNIVTVDGINGYVGLGTSSPQTRLTVVGTNSEAVDGASSVLTADGTLATSSGWTAGTGWSIGSGVATGTSASGNLTGTTTVVNGSNNGTMYKVVFDIPSYTSGSFTVQLGTQASGVTFNSAGTGKVVYLTSQAANAALTFVPTSFTGTIDNVAVYAVTKSTQDMVVKPSDGSSSLLDFRTGGSGFENTFIGDSAGQNTIPIAGVQGTDNTFYGDQAGWSNVSGAHNTFMGDHVGLYNVSGSYNNFTGDAAGYSNLTGSYNVFDGWEAGYLNTTGNNNVFLGYQAAASTTTASDIVAVGYHAGYSNTTGGANVYLGEAADYDNQSGVDIVAVGYGAGQHNTVDKGTFVGYQAGQANSTGDSNTAIGYHAIFQNTTGAQNTVLGFAALDNLTAANNNTAIGYEAGFNDLTGGGNVFLGSTAGYNETGTNKLYVGNGTAGNGTSTLLYGNFATSGTNGKLGINVDTTSSAPTITTTLDVNGLIRVRNPQGETTAPTRANNGEFAFANVSSTQRLYFHANGTDSFINADGTGDYSEFFLKENPSEPLQIGRIVSLDSGKVTKSTGSASPLGVVSAFGTRNNDDMKDGQRGDDKNYQNVGVLGQVPVIVSSENGPIQSGDAISAESHLAGVGTKNSPTPKQTLGRAIQAFTPNDVLCPAAASLDQIPWPADVENYNPENLCFKLPDGTYIGKIMAYVNPGWTDNGIQPSLGADAGDLNINQNTTIAAGKTLTAKGSVLFQASAASSVAFDVQNTSGASLLRVDSKDMKVVVASLEVAGTLTVNGHIVTGGPQPTIAAGPAACIDARVATNGNDTAGTITVTTGIGCTGIGRLATVTFGSAYGAAPEVVLTPANAATSSLQTYVDSGTISTTAFDLSLGGTTKPAANTDYKWYYHVVQ